MGGGQGQGGSCIYYRSPRATSFWNQSPETSLALSVSHFCFHPCALPFCPSCRIKQPALKLHGNKDNMCKPCHMAHLASVCGSDGHTYSSVVRSPGPRRGVGGVHWSPQGAERTAQLGLLWGSQYCCGATCTCQRIQRGRPQQGHQAQESEPDPAPDLGQVQVGAGAWRRPVTASQSK